MAIALNTSKPLCGVLECPLNDQWVLFGFAEGDLVSDLKAAALTTLGHPVSHLAEEDGHIWPGGFFERGAWAIFCENRNGTFTHLRDDDCIPLQPPQGHGDAHTGLVDSWIEERQLSWKGLVHDHDIYDSRDLVVKRRVTVSGVEQSVAVRLVALVLLCGG
jgi:hypothetical protein